MLGNNDEGTAVVQKTVCNYSALAVNFDPSGFLNHTGWSIQADMQLWGSNNLCYDVGAVYLRLLSLQRDIRQALGIFLSTGVLLKASH